MISGDWLAETCIPTLSLLLKGNEYKALLALHALHSTLFCCINWKRNETLAFLGVS